MADQEYNAEEAAELKKKRAFRKFSYRGIDLDDLLDLSSEQLRDVVHARARRRFNRGLKRKPMGLIKKLRKSKQEAKPNEKPDLVKTHLRDMIVVPEMIGSVIGIYSGKEFNQVEIKPEMVGHYLGEFSITYKPVKHGRPGIGATHSSRFIPLKAPTPEHKFATLAVHAGSPHDPTTGAVIEAISLSTTFAQSDVGQPIGQYEYTRSANPNRDNFEKAIAALEHARYALAFSSGSATTAVVLQSLAAGSHVISVSDVYGGTHRYFTKVASAHGVEVTFTHAIETHIASLIRPNETKLIWIESPSNPTLTLTDIRAIASVAHQHGILLVVDNTFLSPYIQNPLDLGADIVVHSVTKYINGHSDVLMGVAAFNSSVLYDRLGFLQNAIGAVPSPFDCWLAHRGLKTLHLRAREASNNAAAVAAALERSPHVRAVNYPGLESHPQRAIALKQHRAGLGGGMLSFRIRGGHTAARAFCRSTKVFTLAESLGGVESLVELPSAMTHAGIPVAERERAGVWDDLVRVSCGIEDGEDLVRDVERALELAVAFSEGKGVEADVKANRAEVTTNGIDDNLVKAVAGLAMEKKATNGASNGTANGVANGHA
ncbi:hypothetical protein EJ06DRAFT_584396 [Trichodelitschia bisporula]|uniref:cystathionine gamma-lyase n=1 Tax=Trichodelitschia bisporula TaxID=703511 RepID=A0A6G1HNI2_9PEZI|nr:hypothetical protein EJ06DRAFT_584396 [Trichodelitschia bisporula]